LGGGDLNTQDPIYRHLANAASCCVIAVDYRRAPEHVWPAAIDDCLDAFQGILRLGR